MAIRGSPGSAHAGCKTGVSKSTSAPNSPGARPRTPDAPAWTRLQGPNQWPAALPELRAAVLSWQAAATRVLTRLLRAFALSLGQSEDVFEPLYRNGPHVLVKLIRYPGRDLTRSDQGVGAHKDSSLLSLLLQDDQGGLQVETAHGWVDVAPRTGALVVNIGELLELARTAICAPRCIG